MMKIKENNNLLQIILDPIIFPENRTVETLDSLFLSEEIEHYYKMDILEVEQGLADLGLSNARFGEFLVYKHDDLLIRNDYLNKYIVTDITEGLNYSKWNEFTGNNFDDVLFHDGDHTFFGWNAWNVVFGGAGNDILLGGDGSRLSKGGL